MSRTQKWGVLHPRSLRRRFRDHVASCTEPLGLSQFIASEISKITSDCSSDGQRLTLEEDGFHPEWLFESSDRKELRSWVYNMFSDMGEAVDRTCAVGNITFLIHGERPPKANGHTFNQNMTMFISTSLQLNPEVTRALSQMRDIFTNDIALPFCADWTRRAVRSGYLSANALTSFSSPARFPRQVVPPPSRSLNPLPLTPSRSARQRHVGTSSTPTSTLYAQGNAGFTLSDAGSTSTWRDGPSFGSVTDVSISPDIEDFLVAIGKDSSANRIALQRVYNFTGKAFWESAVAEILFLNAGTAKALVFLMNDA